MLASRPSSAVSLDVTRTAVPESYEQGCVADELRCCDRRRSETGDRGTQGRYRLEPLLAVRPFPFE